MEGRPAQAQAHVEMKGRPVAGSDAWRAGALVEMNGRSVAGSNAWRAGPPRLRRMRQWRVGQAICGCGARGVWYRCSLGIAVVARQVSVVSMWLCMCVCMRMCM